MFDTYFMKCLMLNPKGKLSRLVHQPSCSYMYRLDATPIRTLRLHDVPFVPSNEPLLRILDRFQEGRSHMAIVSRFSVEEAISVKHEVKKGLRRRLKERVGIDTSDSSSSSESSDEENIEAGDEDNDATLRGDSKLKRRWRGWKAKNVEKEDVEKSEKVEGTNTANEEANVQESKGPMTVTWERMTSIGREQTLPDDGVPPKEAVREVSLFHLSPLKRS